MTLRKPTIVTLSSVVLGLLIASPSFLSPPAHAATDVQETKMKKTNALAGRAFVYEVAGLTIQAEFLAEDKLRWTYLKAPDDRAGNSAEQTVDRRDIHYGIVLLAWTENDGTSVVDILDLQTMTLHANAVLPDGTRFFTAAAVTEVK